MFWRSNSATTSPFFTCEPGLASFCRTSMKSLPPGGFPPEPAPRLAEVEPSPSAPIVVDVELLDPVVLLDDVDELLEEVVLPVVPNRLVAARSALDRLFCPPLPPEEP